MTTIKIVSKETHQEIDYSQLNNITLQQSSVVLIHVNQANVAEIVRQGSHVIVILKSGERIILEKFFNYTDEIDNSLVFLDDQNQLHWVQFKDAQGSMLGQIQFQLIDQVETLLYGESSLMSWGNIGLAVGAVGALALSLGGGGSDSKGSDAVSTVPAKPGVVDGIIDNHGGTQGKILSGQSTDDSTPSISIGTLPSGTTAKLYIGGNLVNSAYDPGTGFITPSTPLANGTYQLSYSLTNELGEGEASDPVTIIIDTTAPVKPDILTNYVDDVGVATKGNFLVQKATDDSTPGFEIGVIPAGHTANLYVNGSKVNSTYNATAGTLTPSVALTDGVYQISYTLTDAAGNESVRSDAISLTIDKTPPNQPAIPTGFIDDIGLNQGNLGFLNATDDTKPSLIIGPLSTGYTAQLYLNNQHVDSVYDSDTGTLTPITALTEGMHNLSYTVVDAAGNESARSPTVTISIDTTSPLQPAAPTGFFDNQGAETGALASGQVTDDTTPDLTIGILSVGLSPVLYVDGERVDSTYDRDSGFITPSEPLGDGLHEVYYTVADLAGNESVASASLNITVSTGAPAKPITPTTFVDNQGADQGTFNILRPSDDTTPSIVIGTLASGEEASLYINNQKVVASYNSTTGTLTPTVALVEGSYIIRYTITNISGIESVKSTPITIVVDTTAPVKPAALYGYIDNAGSKQGSFSIIKATDDSTPSLIIAPVGVTEIANLYVNGTRVESTYDRATGTLTPVQLFTDGNVSLQYSISDAAGNESPLSDAISLVVDLTPPPKPYTPVGIGDNAGSERGVVGNNATIDDPTPGLLIGVIDDDLTATLYINGVKVEAIHDRIVNVLTPTQALNNGTYSMSYTLSDSVGNESVRSDALNVTVNTTPPPATASLMSANDVDLSLLTDNLQQDQVTENIISFGTMNDDIFNLQENIQNTLIFNLLDTVDSIGGNGSDSVNGFIVGHTLTNSNADRIDISELLIGYSFNGNEIASYINGTAVIDQNDTIAQYLSVKVDNENSLLQIDRDGLNNGFEYNTLLTLNNLNVDLETLLANQQIILG